MPATVVDPHETRTDQMQAANTEERSMTGEVLTWIVDGKGRHQDTKAEPGKLAGKIVLQERLNEEDNSKVVYRASAFFKDGRSWKGVMPNNEREFEHNSQTAAFKHGFGHLRDHVNGLYAAALEANEADRAVELNQLRCVVRDQAVLMSIRLKSAKKVELRFADPDEQLQFMKFTRKHFPQLDDLAPIALAFRREEDSEGNGVPRSHGKDANGHTFMIPVKAEKVSKTNGDILRYRLGFAPFFVITIDEVHWEAIDQHARMGLLYRGLSMCCVDVDDEKAWIATRGATEAEIVRALGFPALSRSKQQEVQELVATLRDTGQLDMFERMAAGMVEEGTGT